MALDSFHPQYQDMLPDWQKMRDVYKGERHVKAQRTKYLPATQGMILDGFGKLSSTGVNVGEEAYKSYILRAVLPDFLQDAVEVFMGLLHSQPPKFELPEALEPMREKATRQGESLEQLLRRVNEEQLVTGRVGLLLDLPKNPDPAKPLPYISLYICEAITNWDDGELETDHTKLNMVILDETGYKRNGFSWDLEKQFRVLELTPLTDEDGEITGWGPYRQGVFNGNGAGVPEYVESDMDSPVLRGKPLDDIPFVFINSKDIVAAPDKPPLLGLANLCLTIYRGEADYRQNLFLQGQDTLVVIGDLKTANSDPNELAAAADSEPLRTGTGAMIHLQPGDGADAKYIGVQSSGLSEQRTALENDRKLAESKSSALSTDTNQQASGEALKTRVGARTASLNSIAISGAAGIEQELKWAAMWMGADPNKVKVTPNMEFADYQMTGDMLNKLIAAKRAGAPLSNESIHALMAEGGITKLDYETEMSKVEDDNQTMVPPAGTDAGGNPAPNTPSGQGA